MDGSLITSATNPIYTALKNLENELQLKFNMVVENLTAEVNRLTLENTSLKATNTAVEQTQIELSSTIQRLEDENRSFMKVSKIIAVENENAKLKKDIEEMLQRRVKQFHMPKAQCSQMTQTEDVDTERVPVLLAHAEVQTTEEEPQTSASPTLQSSEEEPQPFTQSVVSMKEKKIGGTLYLVDSDKNVYNKDLNGEAGDVVGRLVSMGGSKMKMVWS
jgi:hypothetical protein